MSELLTLNSKAKPCHATEETHFSCLYFFCQSLSKAYDHRWGWHIDGRLKAYPSGSAPSSPQWSHKTPVLLLMLHYTTCPSHTQLQTASVHAGGCGLMKPTEPRPLQKAETQFSPHLGLKILSMNFTNRIRDKGQAWQSPTPTENLIHFHPNQ